MGTGSEERSYNDREFPNGNGETNSANIGEEPLTDKEFERLMTQINGKSIFDSAKILRDKVLLKETAARTSTWSCSIRKNGAKILSKSPTKSPLRGNTQTAMM